MRKSISIVLIWGCIFSVLTSLSAQNPPLGSLDRYSPILQKDNLLQSNSQEPDIPPLEQIPIDITNDIVMNYEIFARFYHKPIFQLIDREYFFYEESTLTTDITTLLPNDTVIDHKVFDKLYNTAQVDKKKQLREEWKKAFGGVDIWYPYFKAREVEQWVKERLSFKIGKLKGKPQFDEGTIAYVFKAGF